MHPTAVTLMLLGFQVVAVRDNPGTRWRVVREFRREAQALYLSYTYGDVWYNTTARGFTLSHLALYRPAEWSDIPDEVWRQLPLATALELLEGA